jgi:hypothetical protein
VRGDNPEIAYSKLHEMVEIGGNPLLGRLLPLFDQSGNGCLSLQEFRSALQQMAPSQPDRLRYGGEARGVAWRASPAARVYRRRWAAKPRRMQAARLRAGCRQTAGGAPAPCTSAERPHLRAAVALKIMDTDKDEVVSLEDLFWHLKGLLGHALSEAQLEQVG